MQLTMAATQAKKAKEVQGVVVKVVREVVQGRYLTRIPVPKFMAGKLKGKGMEIGFKNGLIHFAFFPFSDEYQRSEYVLAGGNLPVTNNHPILYISDDEFYAIDFLQCDEQSIGLTGKNHVRLKLAEERENGVIMVSVEPLD